MTKEEQAVIDAVLAIGHGQRWPFAGDESNVWVRLASAVAALRNSRTPKPRYEVIRFEFKELVADRATGAQYDMDMVVSALNAGGFTLPLDIDARLRR